MTAIAPALFQPGPLQRLVERLPGVTRETLAEVIVGHLLPQHDCPSSYFHVLNALIAHVGHAGNRVWPSYTRLAALVNEKLAAAGRKGRICAKTAKRGVQYWIHSIGLRVIDDQEELLAGPGEHDYVEAGRKKKGDGPVNHYDLSSLEAQIPTDLVSILDLLVSSGDYKPLPLPPPEPPRDIDARYPDPFVEPAQLCPLDLSEPGSEDLPEDLRFNPFDENPSPLPAISLQETPHPTRLRVEETPSNPCNVSIKPESGSPKKAPTEPARPTRFDGTNLSGITDRYPRAREAPPAPLVPPTEMRQRICVDPHGAGYRALAAAHVGLGVRKKIVAAMGDDWAFEAALYARLQEERGAVQKTKAAYIHGVFRDWQQDKAAGLPTSWPDWLLDRIKRERAAAAQVVRDQAEGNLRQIVKPPQMRSRISEPVEPAPTAEPDPVAALPEGERQALEDRARAELRRDSPGLPENLLQRLLKKRMRVIYDRERGCP